MKPLPACSPLIDDAVIDEVLRSLKSGRKRRSTRARGFEPTRQLRASLQGPGAAAAFQKPRGQYQEGRAVRGSRQGRAMSRKHQLGRRERKPPGRSPRSIAELYSSRTPAVRGCRSPTATSTASSSGLGRRCGRQPGPTPRGGGPVRRDRPQSIPRVPEIRQVVRNAVASGLVARRPVRSATCWSIPNGPVNHRPAQAVNAGGQQRCIRDARARRQQPAVPRLGAFAPELLATEFCPARCGRCTSRANCGTTAH